MFRQDVLCLLIALIGNFFQFSYGFGSTKQLGCRSSLQRGAAFIPTPPQRGFGKTINSRERALSMVPIDDVTSFTSNSLLLAEESWRQYVPLVVSVFIIIDILLGSPAANAVLAPLRNAEKDAGEKEDSSEEPPQQQSLLGTLFGGGDPTAGLDGSGGGTRRKERVDTELVAQAAIDKAKSTLELKQFLEERKTDWDRMEEMKKKLDSDMQVLDDELEERGKELDEKEGSQQ